MLTNFTFEFCDWGNPIHTTAFLDLLNHYMLDPMGDHAPLSKAEQIKEEADRCLSCGKTYVDEHMCVGCGQCTTKCRFDAITLEKVADNEGVDLSKMKPYVIKNLLVTKGKTLVHSAKKKIIGK